MYSKMKADCVSYNVHVHNLCAELNWRPYNYGQTTPVPCPKYNPTTLTDHFFQTTKHHYDPTFSLPNHHPEILNGVLHGILGHNECFLVLVSLKIDKQIIIQM